MRANLARRATANRCQRDSKSFANQYQSSKGYVGTPTMAVMASHCPHIQISVVDLNKRRVDAWNSDELPIFEPGLEGLLLMVVYRIVCFMDRCVFGAVQRFGFFVLLPLRVVIA
jgi:hypothetical protein